MAVQASAERERERERLSRENAAFFLIQQMFINISIIIQSRILEINGSSNLGKMSLIH